MTNYQFNLKIYKGAFNYYVRILGVRGFIKMRTHANKAGGGVVMSMRTFSHIYFNSVPTPYATCNNYQSFS